MLIAGIDAGASRTRCVIYSQNGEEAARQEGPGANLQNRGRDETVRIIGDLLEKALQQLDAEGREADLDTGVQGLARKLIGVGIGIAGCREESDRREIKSRLLKRFSGLTDIAITDDGKTACFSAWAGESGLVAVCGTGSIIYALDDRGSFQKNGGYGPLLGDEGGACRLVLTALRQGLKNWDIRRKREMLDKLLQELELTSIDELIKFVYRKPLPRRELAAAAPMLLREAARGNETCRNLVQQEVEELAEKISALAFRISLTHNRIALAGGLTDSHFYLEMLVKALKKEKRYHFAEIKIAELDNACGAAVYALFRARKQGKLEKQILEVFLAELKCRGIFFEIEEDIEGDIEDIGEDIKGDIEGGS